MKKFNSIIRTLCLVALLCLTSGNAFAYKIFRSGDIEASSSLAMGSDKILVVTENATVNNCIVDAGYALVILPGVRVEVTKTFVNEGTIYVFGVLACWNYPYNGGTINKIDGAFYYNELVKQGTINENFNPFQLVPIKAPTSNENGCKEYWEAKIDCGDDVYPMYYEDESRTKQINNLDAWKAGDGKLVYKSAPTKIDGQQPNAEHDFVGWKDYYQQVCTESTGSDYNIYFEDEAFTKTIPDLEAWKTGDGMLSGAEIGKQLYILEKQNGEFVYNGDLTFTDKEAFISPNDFTVTGGITYSRTFTNTGVWQTWFVPFDVTVGEMNEAGMDVAKIAGVLMNEEEPYIAFAKMKDKDAIVKANTPYVVKATTSSVNIALTGSDINIRKSTDEELQAQRLTVQSSFETFTFGGNYKTTNGYENQWYTLNTSGVFRKMGEGVNLAPQRFWMTIATRTDTPYYTSSASAKEIIRMTVLGEDEANAIHNAEFIMHNDDDTIYNLNGQKVNSVQSGHVYIMNGKRFIAK